MDDTTDIDFSTPNTVTAETSKIVPRMDTEKCDTSPEFYEKSSSDTKLFDHKPPSLNEVILIRKNNVDSNKSEAKDKKNTGFAFTIDLSEGRTVDQRKQKEMAQHFQNRQIHQQEKRRHRRGVSLSKLEDCQKFNNLENREATATVDDSGVTSVMNKNDHTKICESVDYTKVDGISLRISRPETANETKRHSWSPWSSLNSEKPPPIEASSSQVLKYIENISSFQPKSSTLQHTLTSKDSSKIKAYKNLITESTVDNVIKTPLEYVRSSDEESSVGDISQATYTLDGDNYTEEEKERMSIDKFNRSDFNLSIDSLSKRYVAGKNPIDKTFCETKRDNKKSVRNSTEKEQSTTQKSAKFYLDKIKARVKFIGDRKLLNNNKKESPIDRSMCPQTTHNDESTESELDHGTFTR